jgi:hypothetical protein
MEPEAHMLVLRRPLLVAAGALVLAVMAGCEQDRQPSTAAPTTTAVASSTTTRPPVTADRAWMAGVVKLRQRLDRVFLQSGVVLTQAKVREYTR